MLPVGNVGHSPFVPTQLWKSFESCLFAILGSGGDFVPALDCNLLI